MTGTLEQAFNLGPLSAADDRNHEPGPAADDRWQESWGFIWCDPRAKACGYQHTGLQRPRGIADVWSWASVRGQMVHRYQHLQLPLPTDDYSDLRVGPLHITSRVPMRERAVVIADGSFNAALEYRGFTGPLVPFAPKHGYQHVAAGHYQTIGTVNGSLEVGGETIAIRGHAFDDRSWGLRDWGDQLTHRACWACFGDDLFLVFWHVTSPRGSVHLGYVFDGGVLHRVEQVDVEVRIASDGTTPIACDVTGWTDSGRAYRVRGKTLGANLMTQRDGFLQTAAVGIFEHGDRIGAGGIEVNELKRPAPWHLPQLEPRELVTSR